MNPAAVVGLSISGAVTAAEAAGVGGASAVAEEVAVAVGASGAAEKLLSLAGEALTRCARFALPDNFDSVNTDDDCTGGEVALLGETGVLSLTASASVLGRKRLGFDPLYFCIHIMRE